ncbi:MAG: snoRNP complex protein nop56 [Alyxoria varia]|nr:MAG: snoRNP complex protein nop56 [Alyxoria varia]
MSSVDYVLYESAMGYALFQVRLQPDAIGSALKECRDVAGDLAKFGKMVRVVSFLPFQGAAQALDEIKSISEGNLSELLQNLLEANLPQPDKDNPVSLGVAEKTLGNKIKEAFKGLEVRSAEKNTVVMGLLRGIRFHAPKLLKQLQDGDIERAQLGLAHAYSRSKVQYNVNRDDNHIIQSIATLDHLDKSINQFAMRIREWYGWHFPELIKIVSDNTKYTRLVRLIGDKQSLTGDDLSEDRKKDITAIVDGDEAIMEQIVDAAKVSMGRDISEQDMDSVMTFAKNVVNHTELRKSLTAYLTSKMGVVAPNLAALIGDTVGARLISHAGSLTNLSKYPASTVQILGAEKALFRALKTKSATPKYGLIYHSSFIGRTATKNKGRISRYLANKCSIASRIDNFSTTAPTTRFGEELKKQVDARIQFYTDGTAVGKNVDAMQAAMDDVLDEMQVEVPGKQRASEPVGQANGDEDVAMSDAPSDTKSKSKSKSKREITKKDIRKLKKEENRKRKREVDAAGA